MIMPLPIRGLRAKVRCRGWATLSEHKWSSFGERRGTLESVFDGAPRQVVFTGYIAYFSELWADAGSLADSRDC